MCWYDDNLKSVYLLKLKRLCICGTRHTRKFVIESEIILISDGSESLVLILNCYTFLGLNRLV